MVSDETLALPRPQRGKLRRHVQGVVVLTGLFLVTLPVVFLAGLSAVLVGVAAALVGFPRPGRGR
jgi:hypothetical protein